MEKENCENLLQLSAIVLASGELKSLSFIVFGKNVSKKQIDFWLL